MSPVAGVGINVAVQDAVAAANRLTEPLRRGAVTDRDLAAVQKQREFAVRVVQRMQRVMPGRVGEAPGARTRRFRFVPTGRHRVERSTCGVLTEGG
jgi:2-polyprenyl-6-methoxyphenol hydroxylase-like FAD-dependent oxidoreductase